MRSTLKRLICFSVIFLAMFSLVYAQNSRQTQIYVKLLLSTVERTVEDSVNLKKECEDTKTPLGRNKCRELVRTEAEELVKKKAADSVINSLPNEVVEELKITKDEIRSNIETTIRRDKQDIVEKGCTSKESFCEYDIKVFVEIKISDNLKHRLDNIVRAEQVENSMPEVATKYPEKSPAGVRPYKLISPFSRHEDRYQDLFDSLVKGGMSPDRIYEIFSSARAKETDMTPIDKMSKITLLPSAKRKSDELSIIAKRIKRHIENYTKEYDELERRFEVNREVVAAILFKETSLGKFKNWKHESFTVLNTILGFMELSDKADDRRKIRMGRIISRSQKSLEKLLLYCNEYHISIIDTKFPSSFSGAIGIPQFLPMHMDYVITSDNSVPDLNKMSDAILSAGNILKNKFNWPGSIDFRKLENIDEIIAKYEIYDNHNSNVSFCIAIHLDGYPLRTFTEEFDDIPHVDYIGKFATSLMNYNFSSVYSLDVLQLAFYVHKLR